MNNANGYCPVPAQKTNGSCIYSATGELRCSDTVVDPHNMRSKVEPFCADSLPSANEVMPIGEYLNFNGRPLDYTGNTMIQQGTPTCKDQLST
jgi:hypothetical protein